MFVITNIDNAGNKGNHADSQILTKLRLFQ